MRKLGTPFTLLLSSILMGQAQNAPIITDQTASLTNWVGANVSLSVAVSGPGPFTYQWRFNGTNIHAIDIITTLAGGRATGFSGDGGPATNAVLFEPSGVAFDAAGNLFIADQWNNRIRKVDTNGVINTVAGIGPISTGGTYSGDGGMATNAGLNLPTFGFVFPAGVAVDVEGNFYIGDGGNSRIRKVDTNGIINTMAGTNTAGFSGDGGLAVNAKLNSSSGVVVDNSGNVFIVDAGNNLIRKVGINGIITTLAGNRSAGYTGDGGAATNASLNRPFGVAVDPSGNMFIADEGNSVIRKVDTNGIITTFAGNGTAGYAGDGGAATNASMNQPYGVAVDVYDDVFITDYGNNRIRMVGANGTITTVAGTGIAGRSSDGTVATNANLFEPTGVGLDNYGNLFFTEGYYSDIRKVDLGRVPTLQLNHLVTTNAGNYDVVVSSPYGSVTSSVVTLTVLSQPVIQPPYQPIVAGSDMSFAAVTNGYPQLSYQWQFNGTNIAGATNASLTLTNVQATNEGGYDIVATADFGSTTSANALLFDWASTLNTPGLIWTTGGDAPWFPETTMTHDGVEAAQSGSVALHQLSTLQTTVDGPGTLSFWWNISSAGSLSFLLNGTSQGRISLIFPWRQQTYYLGAGTQTLAWNYVGGSFPFGTNAAWLDQVSFVPGGTSPGITSAPNSLYVRANSNATFTVGAVGTPPLIYQWLFNQTVISNQTNATLSLLNAQPSNSGNYSVVVSNNYGSVSTNASLFVQAFAMDTTNLFMRTNGFQLQLDGILTTNPVVILASTDLVSWLPVFTNSATTGSVQFLDITATNLPVRFYRAEE